MMLVGCGTKTVLAKVKVIAVFALVPYTPDSEETVVAKDILMHHFCVKKVQ